EDDDVGAAVREHVFDAFDELVAVHPRHHQIEEDEIVAAVRAELVETDLAVLGQPDVELHPPQDGLQQDADGQVIVDDQDPASAPVDFSNRHSSAHFAKNVPTSGASHSL